MDDHIPHWHIVGFTLMTIALTTTTWLMLNLIGAWTLLVLALTATIAWTTLWLDRRWTRPHLRRRDLRRVKTVAEHIGLALLVGAFLILAMAGGTLIGAYPS